MSRCCRAAGRIAAAAHRPAAGRPNLLFLITDQQTAGALSCEGNPYVKTPNLDRLAARGMRFEKSYCTYPLCCPSRGSLFTSRMPHELGIYGNFDAELSENGVPTMGDLFQAAGYETAYAGKWHLQVPFPAFKSRKIPGFAVLPLAGKDPHAIDLTKEGKGLTVDPNTADAAITFLRRPHDRPFLLTVSVLNPHDICEYTVASRFERCCRPIRPTCRRRDPTCGPSTRYPLHPAIRGAARRLDRSPVAGVPGRLLPTRRKGRRRGGPRACGLDQTGLSNTTVILFTSDHGEMMGSHQMVTKQKLYEESATVPLIVAPPGAAAAVDAQHLVSGLDVLPTLLDYAGIAAPASLAGRSLRPLVEGRPFRGANFSYRRPSTPPKPEWFERPATNMSSSPRATTASSSSTWRRPGETKNLIADRSLAAEVEQHRALLKHWMKDTNDAFGKAPARPKAKARTAQAKPGPKGKSARQKKASGQITT